MLFQYSASLEDECQPLNQPWVFTMDSSNLPSATLDN